MNQPLDYRHCPYDGEPLRPEGAEGGCRPWCPRCGFVDYQNPRPCVCIVILRGHQILLARRAVEPAKGQWDIPGGFVDAAESAEQAVVREALEETALHVRVARYLGSMPDVYGDRSVPTLNLCFTADVVSGELRARDDVAELLWVDLVDTPARMAFAHQHQMLQWVRELIVQGGLRQNPSGGKP